MEVVYKVYQVLQDDRVSLQDFINRLKQSGQWGSTLDMVFSSLVLNVNIISISNMLQKFETFSTMEFFRKLRLDNYIHSNAETVYIYHHAFGSPFCPSLNPNHFCTLMPIKDERIDHNSEWYERHKYLLVSSKPYIDSPIREKAKHSTVDYMVLAPRNVQATESFYLLGGQDHATFPLNRDLDKTNYLTKIYLKKD